MLYIKTFYLTRALLISILDMRTNMEVIKIAHYECCRCGHPWIPRRNRRPGVCPACKNRQWDIPKKKGCRDVMSEAIGRPLKKWEVVHHINHIRTDNEIKNLFLCSRSEHMYIHSLQRKGHDSSCAIEIILKTRKVPGALSWRPPK